jgi:hypothetical protein
MIVLSNAFSLNMLENSELLLKVSEVSLPMVKALLQSQEWSSAVGHQSTADVLTALLGTSVPSNRVSVKLTKGDTLIAFQLLTRLEEGRVLTAEEIKALPYKFYLVELLPPETMEALYHW